jgi:DNA helicase-2/ATP-dependent DNA helicase PcrA
VVGEIRDARARGLAWSQLAVLFRTNAQAKAFVNVLQTAGIPYRSSGADAGRDADGVDPAEDATGDRWPEDWWPADAVTLSTFHRAKGLEWKAVWVTGLERGLVPISHASTPAALAEERRVLYVALTRAESELHCSWAEQRSLGVHPVPREPSPWLEELGRATLVGSGGHACATDDRAPAGTSLATPRNRLAACRRPARGGPGTPGLTDGDQAVLEALHRWRSAAARATGVPPFVLFHDVTLRAVATTRPSTSAELLAVPGVGPVKAGRYGAALLAVLAEHRAAG